MTPLNELVLYIVLLHDLYWFFIWLWLVLKNLLRMTISGSISSRYRSAISSVVYNHILTYMILLHFPPILVEFLSWRRSLKNEGCSDSLYVSLMNFFQEISKCSVVYISWNLVKFFIFCVYGAECKSHISAYDRPTTVLVEKWTWGGGRCEWGWGRKLRID